MKGRLRGIRDAVPDDCDPTWIEAAGIFARRIEIHLERQQFAAAEDVLAECRGECESRRSRPRRPPPPTAETLLTRLVEVCDDPRIVNTLEWLGVFTVGDLLVQTRESLKKCPQFGPASLRKLYEMLAGLGFEVPPWRPSLFGKEK